MTQFSYKNTPKLKVLLVLLLKLMKFNKAFHKGHQILLSIARCLRVEISIFSFKNSSFQKRMSKDILRHFSAEKYYQN